MSQQMSAIRVREFGGPDKLLLEEDVTRPSPAGNEILIKVSAIGVNPVETYIRTGTFALKPALPYTPGTDAAGVVEEVGSEVKCFKKGDRVYTTMTTSGSYADYVTAEVTYVAHLDDKLSFAQGAALGVPYYTAVRALHFRANAKPGQTILVHGASGAVGQATVQLAKALGLRVLGTAGSKEGLDLIKQLGADLVFNHREAGYLEAVKKTGEPDLILEVLGDVNLDKDIDLIKVGGQILLVGARGPATINPTAQIGKECSITGVLLWNSTADEWREMHCLLAAGQRLGWVDPKVSKVYSMAQAGQAHHDVMNTQGTKGKLVIDTLL